MSVTGNIGNKGNKCHTTSDSGNDVNKVPNQSSRNHVCHVRRKIQMSDVGFVKIIIIWCLRLPIGRRRVKSIREDCQPQMSVTGNIGNKGNRRHTTSDSGNDGNKVPNPKLQLLVTLVTV